MRTTDAADAFWSSPKEDADVASAISNTDANTFSRRCMENSRTFCNQSPCRQTLIDLDQLCQGSKFLKVQFVQVFVLHTDAAMPVNENSDLAYIIPVLFIVVFVLNVLPAFAPPTWTTMSFMGLAVPNIDVLLLALVAATAAACGGILVAKLSRIIVRQKLLTEQVRRNVDAIRIGIENRRAMTLGTFLGYSLSPLPSNYLFIAYGLTSLPIAFLALPFFIGRFVSYAFWSGPAPL